jgi:Flp pilus assembly protein TadG
MKIFRTYAHSAHGCGAQLCRFHRNERGIALIEFALILPILVLIFYGTIELTRYIQMIQKMDNATSTLTDLVNRNLNLTNQSLANIADTAPAMLQPFDSAGVGVIVTAIQRDAGRANATTKWQRSYPDGFKGPSRISAGEDQQPTLPQLELEPRDQVITVELFLEYRPILNSAVTRSVLGLENNNVYRMNVARPRYGAFEFDPA